MFMPVLTPPGPIVTDAKKAVTEAAASGAQPLTVSGRWARAYSDKDGFLSEIWTERDGTD